MFQVGTQDGRRVRTVVSATGNWQADSERLRIGKVKRWGLEVEGAETQRGFLGASGALKTLRETKEQRVCIGQEI